MNSNEYKRTIEPGLIEFMASQPRTYEETLRTWASTFIRIYTAGRPQDPAKMFRETIITDPPNCPIKKAKSIRFRLYDTKSAKDPNFNTEAYRTGGQSKAGLFDTEEKIFNPMVNSNIPDYFKILHFYLAMTENKDKPTITIIKEGTAKKFTPTFIKIQNHLNKRASSEPLTTQRISKCTLKLLQDSEAIPIGNESLKAWHIRHTTLSYIYHWHQASKERRYKVLSQILSNSRNRKTTVEAKYILNLPIEVRKFIEEANYKNINEQRTIGMLLAHVPPTSKKDINYT